MLAFLYSGLLLQTFQATSSERVLTSPLRHNFVKILKIEFGNIERVPWSF